jgi:hypothetical protein
MNLPATQTSRRHFVALDIGMSSYHTLDIGMSSYERLDI